MDHSVYIQHYIKIIVDYGLSSNCVKDNKSGWDWSWLTLRLYTHVISVTFLTFFFENRKTWLYVYLLGFIRFYRTLLYGRRHTVLFDDGVSRRVWSLFQVLHCCEWQKKSGSRLKLLSDGSSSWCVSSWSCWWFLSLPASSSVVVVRCTQVCA